MSIVSIPPSVWGVICLMTCTVQRLIVPAPPVEKRKYEKYVLRFVSVCTPSEKEKASGVTSVGGVFGGSGLASVTIAVTESFLLYGADAVVNGFPVYTYVMGTANVGCDISAAV